MKKQLNFFAVDFFFKFGVFVWRVRVTKAKVTLIKNEDKILYKNQEYLFCTIIMLEIYSQIKKLIIQ